MREGSTRSWPHQISRQYSDKEVANSQAECVGLSTVMFYCILVSMATTILVVQLTHCWGKLTFQNDASSAGLNWYFSYVFTSSYSHTGCVAYRCAHLHQGQSFSIFGKPEDRLCSQPDPHLHGLGSMETLMIAKTCEVVNVCWNWPGQAFYSELHPVILYDVALVEFV